MTAAITNLEHPHWCQPRPGEDEPRIERYTLPRYDQDGLATVALVQVVRCCECGVCTYDGVKRD